MLWELAWPGFGLIGILGRYGAVQGRVVLMPCQGVSVSAQWQARPCHSSAWCSRNAEDRKDRTEGTGHAEPVAWKKKRDPPRGWSGSPPPSKEGSYGVGLLCFA